jgi:two-component system, OmpR family, response regulator
MFPHTLALIDDDAEFAEPLAQALRARGCRVELFADSNDLLAEANAFDFEFYVLDLMLPGIDGVDLIKVLRRRSTAGLLVVSGRLAPDVFSEVIGAGADMYLAKPVNFGQVVLAVEAVQRRAAMANPANTPWRLDRRARQLVAPDGARADLGESDLALLECFLEADGMPVTREALCLCLGRAPDGDATDGLNSTIHRLKRRIERATDAVVPLHSKSRVGYVFRAPLTAA